MSQDRILGSATKIQIYTTTGTQDLAEIDSFTAKSADEAKAFTPLGQVEPHKQLIYGGYNLTIKGAKINADYETIQAANDSALLDGNSAPRYRIVHTTTWLDGTVEEWAYTDCLLYGFNIDAGASNDEIKQDCTGFAAKRTRLE